MQQLNRITTEDEQPEQGTLRVCQKQETKVLLFVCTTYYQLISILNIRLNMYRDEIADILFTDSSDFSNVIPNIERTGLFRNIYTCVLTERMRGISRMSLELQMAVYDPDEIFKSLDLQSDYTDMFADFNKQTNALYCYLLSGGIQVRVHCLDDGMASFWTNISRRMEVYYFMYRSFASEQYITQHIAELFLYAPELYIGPPLAWPITKLETLKHGSRLHNILRSIFGELTLPREKYIFLEQANAGHSIAYPVEDFCLVERIAAVVGKENMIIKLHPRSKADRFSRAGYKVMDNLLCPWEMALFEDNLEDKVLISVSSTAIITPMIHAGIRAKAISLANVARGSKNAAIWPENFQKRLVHEFNKDEKLLYLPKNIRALEALMHFIKGLDAVNQITRKE